ncbi:MULTISPECIES: hypothetical protein [unclassified Caballeronia]|uniref:hypothetical protein n=1 Tax=unclassified Caballeronia TaxID=2646786 RepID=UPI00285C58EA|nr:MULTISPECIES: hypothetical protein [unclassified Caballeronia]MDR5736671.1 hypothetical protein [Caballeronia sp. LZ016]MDR5810848.1 hypothetical protein [Caballeronia sp. LZ019]
MTQAISIIGQAVNRVEATSRQASRGVRVALAFGIVAGGYGLVVVSALHGAGAGAFA